LVNMMELTQKYQRAFGDAPPMHLVRAPGRVNLIGEHTDYNDGFVLPIAMSQALYVLAGPSDDGRIKAQSTAFDESLSFPADDPGQPGEPKWGNYVRGVAAMLVREGIALQPGRLLIHSDVPIGGGVSSSAALEIGSALGLLALAGASMERVPLALLARQAEHQFAGSPCGIMDQFICALGQADHALMLDCRTQAYQQVPFKPADAELFVMNTQVKHEIASGEYAARQQQCQEAVRALQTVDSGVKALRDADAALLDNNRSHVSDVAYRRARHAITENRRTVRATEAMGNGDFTTFGKLMFESHASLRDDYEVSCEELDALIEIASSVPGVYGARMTGGGFGGCAIALADRSAEAALRGAVNERYDTKYEKPAIVYTTSASDGAETTALS
jgi:galactokinase